MWHLWVTLAGEAISADMPRTYPPLQVVELGFELGCWTWVGWSLWWNKLAWGGAFPVPPGQLQGEGVGVPAPPQQTCCVPRIQMGFRRNKYLY